MNPAARKKQRYRRQLRKYRKATRQQQRRDRAGSMAELRQPAGEDLPYSADLERFLSSVQQRGDVARAQRDEGMAALQQDYFDPSDPFSRTALMNRSLRQAADETFRGGAAAGRLYSGSLVAAQLEDAHRAGGQRRELERGFMGAAGELQRGYADQVGALAAEGEGALFDAARSRAADIEATSLPSFRAMGRDALGNILPKPKKKHLTKPIKPRFMR